ncbi:GNAT family N-acetyltransferase [Microbacterium aurantiacum]|uniref:GNAT family N-acetyltransferase n=1 Tax=Microbacterium aurantiacum TaxID=162393 RepID=UPI00343666B0
MLTIRRRTEADLSTIVGWIPDAAALYLFTGPRMTWPLTTEELGTMNADENFTAWVALGEGARLVGHFDLTVVDRTARLGRVVIDPSQRGRGMGRELVGLVIETARAVGADELRLNVIANNVPAVRAYEGVGFRTLPQGDRPDIRSMALALSQ